MVNRVVFSVPPESSGGGAEMHAYSLANHLAALGHRIDFVTRTGKGAEYESLVKPRKVPPERSVIPPKTSFFGWTLKHLFGSLLSFLVAVREFGRAKDGPYDLIHCHGGLTALMMSLTLGKRVPIVY